MTPQISSLVWMLAAPSNLLLLTFVVGCVLLAVTRRRRGFALIVGATLGAVLITVLPIAPLALRPLEDRFPQPSLPAHVDGIVVLGGSISTVVSGARQRPSVRDASERLFAAIELARQYPQARIILAGGIVHPYPGARSEADWMSELIASAGIPTARFELEKQSRNTFENALYAHELARPKDGETWVLVTSANHMPRAVGSFRKAGWRIIPYPVDFLTTGKVILPSAIDVSKELRRMDLAAHEWLGLVGYWLIDRSEALFPAPR